MSDIDTSNCVIKRVGADLIAPVQPFLTSLIDFSGIVSN